MYVVFVSSYSNCTVIVSKCCTVYWNRKWRNVIKNDIYVNDYIKTQILKQWTALWSLSVRHLVMYTYILSNLLTAASKMKHAVHVSLYFSTGFNGLNSSWWLKQSFVFQGFKEGWYHKNYVHTFVLSRSDMLFDVHVFRTLHHGSWYVFLCLLVVCAVLTTFRWCNT